MQARHIALVLAASLGLAGCGDLNQTQQRTATGALGGAALGGILGSFSGNAGLGALLGAGVGGGGGYLYDQSQRSQQPAYAQRYRGGDSYRRY
jgi:uncharacterized membrane protein